jgi:hypothetical protein
MKLLGIFVMTVILGTVLGGLAVIAKIVIDYLRGK